MKFLAVLLVAVVTVGCGSADKGRQMGEAMRVILDDTTRPGFVTADAEGTALWKQTRQFYESRAFSPAWIKDAKPMDQMEDLVEALQQVDRDGLDPELYSATLIKTRREDATRGFLTDPGFDPDEAGRLDVWLTYLYLKHAADLANGISDLASADKRWRITPETFDPLAHLTDAIDRDRIADSLADLRPQHREYSALREALAAHRTIAADGGWPLVPENVRLKPGQSHAAVASVAKRLAVSGDYAGPTDVSTYTEALQTAVQTFQARHGLAAAGLVGAETVAALNVPVDARIRQIALNLERWRWLPQNMGERYVLVNIPEMRLRIYEGDRVPLTMAVVVGTPDTPTPIFNDQMRYVVLSPYWNVPDSIAQGETVPGLVKDPTYLTRNNMEIVDKSGTAIPVEDMDMDALDQYRFRQRPGKANSLGLVKFMFPNEYNVYLHDTPADSLFARAGRAFSHGCVRVEKPMALAEYVLRDQPKWTTEAIDTAMHAGTETQVPLTAPLPVYLGYWTASVDEAGTLHFRSDVYGIDADQQKRLTERMNRLKKADKPAETQKI
jgi:murein L,D-transpeptidase YcbB/YkuD